MQNEDWEIRKLYSSSHLHKGILQQTSCLLVNFVEKESSEFLHLHLYMGQGLRTLFTVFPIVEKNSPSMCGNECCFLVLGGFDRGEVTWKPALFWSGELGVECRGVGGKKNPQEEENLKITSLLSPFPTPMIVPSYLAPWKYPKDTLGRESQGVEREAWWETWCFIQERLNIKGTNYHVWLIFM